MATIPAPYGHACTNCVRAKCRCILRTNGDACDRCFRLSKQCRPSTAVRRSGRQRIRLTEEADTQVETSKIKELEKRLEEVVSRLQALEAQQAPRHEIQKSDSDTPDDCSTSLQFSTELTPALPLVLESAARTPAFAQTGVSRAPAEAAIQELDGQEAEECLAIFRTQHLQFLPFTYISSTVTYRTLQQRRPFLWLCIKAICAKTLDAQDAHARCIREILAHRLMIEGERSIDLLLGLVACLSWSKYIDSGRRRVNLWLNLVSTLAADLGLDGSLRPAINISCFKHQRPASRSYDQAHTKEELRALLAGFIVNSSLSSFFKLSVFGWRLDLDEAIEGLSDGPEYPGDLILIAMAKMARLIQDAANVMASIPRNSEEACVSFLHVKPLQLSLEALKKNLPAEVLKNDIIRIYLCTVETFIYSIPLVQYKENASYGLSHDSKRVEVLHQCLYAAKHSTETFLTFPADRYMGINILFSVLFRHSTQTLYRLSALKDPCWDSKIVQDTIDVVHCLERAIERFQEAADIAGSTGIIPAQVLLSKTVAGLKNSISAWKYELGLSGNDTTPMGLDGGANTGEDFAPMFMDFVDDTWLLPWPISEENTMP